MKIKNLQFFLALVCSCISVLVHRDIQAEDINFAYISIQSYPFQDACNQPCYSTGGLPVRIAVHCDDQHTVYPPLIPYSTWTPSGDPSQPPIIKSNIVTVSCPSVSDDTYIEISNPSSVCPQDTSTSPFYLKDTENNNSNRVYVITDMLASDIWPSYPYYSLLYTDNFANPTEAGGWVDSLLTSGQTVGHFPNVADRCELSLNSAYYSDWQSSDSTDQDCCQSSSEEKKETKKKEPQQPAAQAQEAERRPLTKIEPKRGKKS